MDIFNTFTNYDMFQALLNVNVKRKAKMGSHCGLIFTVITIGIWLTLFLVFGFDMMYRTNPSFTQYTLIGGLKDDTVDISTDKFMFLFGLYDVDNDYALFNNASYFTTIASLITPENKYSLNFEPCTQVFQDYPVDGFCFE